MVTANETNETNGTITDNRETVYILQGDDSESDGDTRRPCFDIWLGGRVIMTRSTIVKAAEWANDNNYLIGKLN